MSEKWKILSKQSLILISIVLCTAIFHSLEIYAIKTLHKQNGESGNKQVKKRLPDVDEQCVRPKQLTIPVRTKKGSLSCLFCKHYVTSLDDLKAHMLTHNKEKQCQCSICTRWFDNEIILNNHMTTHRQQKSYPCKECGEILSDSIRLECHMRGHRNEESIRCKICNQIFCYQSSLKDHMDSYHGDKRFEEMPFRCEECKVGFFKKPVFRSHMQRHKKKILSPVQCSICQNPFSSQHSLNCHLRSKHKKRESADTKDEDYKNELKKNTEEEMAARAQEIQESASLSGQIDHYMKVSMFIKAYLHGQGSNHDEYWKTVHSCMLVIMTMMAENFLDEFIIPKHFLTDQSARKTEAAKALDLFKTLISRQEQKEDVFISQESGELTEQKLVELTSQMFGMADQKPETCIDYTPETSTNQNHDISANFCAFFGRNAGELINEDLKVSTEIDSHALATDQNPSDILTSQEFDEFIDEALGISIDINSQSLINQAPDALTALEFSMLIDQALSESTGLEADLSIINQKLDALTNQVIIQSFLHSDIFDQIKGYVSQQIDSWMAHGQKGDMAHAQSKRDKFLAGIQSVLKNIKTKLDFYSKKNELLSEIASTL